MASAYAVACVKKAKSWNGLKEGAPVDKAIMAAWNKAVHRNAKSKTTPWCEITISSDFIQTKCIKGSYYCGAGCTQAMKWYKNKRRFKKRGTKVKVSWQVFYNFKNPKSTTRSTHTGIVVATNGKYIIVQEGNHKNKCARRTILYNSKYIVGFDIPCYK